MPDNQLTLSSIRSKIEKGNALSVEELISFWSYVNNPKEDDLSAVMNKNNKTEEDTLKARRNDFKKEVLFGKLFSDNLDLDHFNKGDLENLRSLLEHVSGLSMNLSILHDKLSREIEEKLENIQEETPVHETEVTETPAEEPVVENEAVYDGESVVGDTQPEVETMGGGNSQDTEKDNTIFQFEPDNHLDSENQTEENEDSSLNENNDSPYTSATGEEHQDDSDEDVPAEENAEQENQTEEKKEDKKENSDTDNTDEAPETDENLSEEEAFNEIYGKPNKPVYISDNLEAISKLPDTYELLDKNKEGKAIHPEFQDVSDALYKLVITRTNLMGKEKPVSDAEAGNDIYRFEQQTRHETEIYLANTSNGQVSLDDFKKEYADRLRVNLLLLTGAQATVDRADKQKISEEFGKLFSSNSGQIRINQDTLAGFQAYKQSMAEKAVGLMTKALGEEKAVSIHQLAGSVKNLNKQLQSRYGKKYVFLKNILKSAGWGAAYGVAATAAGPAGIAAVATASLANQMWGMYKDYKQQKQKIIGRIRAGEKVKPLTFKKYLNQNKMRLAGMALTTATAIGGLAGTGGVDILSFQAGKTIAGLSLAGVGAINQATRAYQKTEGSKLKKGIAAAGTFGASVVSFAAGWWAGSTASEVVAGFGDVNVPATDNAAHMDNTPAVNDTSTAPAPTTEVTDTVRVVQEAPADSLQQSVPAAPAPAPEAVNQPADSTRVVMEHQTPAPTGNDGQTGGDSSTSQTPANPEVAPAIDVNNLTAEQQHDMKMLFLRDPAEANEILGNDGDKWLNSRELQEAWDNGDISAEQKEALVKFAGERFDDKGNFVDVDGKTSAAAMEADAKAYSAASHARDDSPLPNPTPEEAFNQLTPEGKAALFGSANAELAQDQNVADEQPNTAVLGSEVSMTALDNGNFVFAADMANGVPVHITMDQSGNITDMVINAHGEYADYQCSENEINVANTDPAFKDMRENLQSRLPAAENQPTTEVAQATDVIEVKTPENSAFSDVKFDKNNGDISFTYERSINNSVVHATMGADGELKAFSIDAHGDKPAHEYSKHELSQLNKNESFKEISKGWHQDISAMLNGTESQNLTNNHPDLARVSNVSQSTPTAHETASTKVVLTPQQLQNATRGRG